MSMKVSPVCVTNPRTVGSQPKMSKMDTMFERYDHMFSDAEKDLMNNVADAVVETVKDKGYSEKQIDNFMNKFMSAFETLTPKEQAQYVDEAVRFLANA